MFFPPSESLSVLESCTVSVFIPGKKYGEDADQQLSFPVQCSFWALSDSTDASRRSGRADGAVLGTAVGVVLALYSLKCGLNVYQQAFIVWYSTPSSRNVPFHSAQMLFVDSTDKTGN